MHEIPKLWHYPKLIDAIRVLADDSGYYDHHQVEEDISLKFADLCRMYQVSYDDLQETEDYLNGLNESDFFAFVRGDPENLSVDFNKNADRVLDVFFDEF